MAKRNSARDLRKKLLHVMITCMRGIHEASVELEGLNLTKEEWDEKGDKAQKAWVLLGNINLLTYVMAPFFGMARAQFPAEAKFLDAIEDGYRRSLKDGVYKECGCVGCKEDGNRDNNQA